MVIISGVPILRIFTVVTAAALAKRLCTTIMKCKYFVFILLNAPGHCTFRKGVFFGWLTFTSF